VNLTPLAADDGYAADALDGLQALLDDFSTAWSAADQAGEVTEIETIGISGNPALNDRLLHASGKAAQRAYLAAHVLCGVWMFVPSSNSATRSRILRSMWT